MQPKDHSDHLKFLDDLIPDVLSGDAIPIISNSFRIEELFKGEKELLDKIAAEKVEFDDEENTIDEKLTKAWAESIYYPMADDHNLARVAQYYQVEEKDSERAKSKYLAFLKNYLLKIDENVINYPDYINGVKNQVDQHQFSAIAKSLDYPRFSKERDPLRLLAKLPFRVYITTSYFNFIERALEDEGKVPHTLVYFWDGGETKALPVHKKHLNPDVDITEKNPLVYHVFGLENYPRTLVLSEDDYINFLVAVFQDTDTQNPKVPLYIKGMLAERRLILLGYHLKDWDFRILFKLIMEYRGSKSNNMPRGILIQLKPTPARLNDEERSVNYLKTYFDKKQFDVDWTWAENFIHELSKKCDQATGKVYHE